MTATMTMSMTTMTTTTATPMAARRRKEIAFLARDLFGRMQDLAAAVGGLVPSELANGDGTLTEGHPLGAVADQLDEALLCFGLLQEELGLPAGVAPRFRK